MSADSWTRPVRLDAIKFGIDTVDAARHDVLGRMLCSHTERQVTQRAQDACRVLDGRLDEDVDIARGA